MKRRALAAALLTLVVAAPVAAQEESYTIAQLQQRCEDAAPVPGIADTEGACKAVLALILFPDTGLELPDFPDFGDGGSSTGDQPVTRSGGGDQQTEPFELSGGDYRVGSCQRLTTTTHPRSAAYSSTTCWRPTGASVKRAGTLSQVQARRSRTNPYLRPPCWPLLLRRELQLRSLGGQHHARLAPAG